MRDIMSLQIVTNAIVNGFAYERVIEQRGTDADSAGPCKQKLDCIVGVVDTTLSNNRDVVLFADLMNLMHLKQCNGFDRRSRQPALIVTYERSTAFNVDGHTHQGIDDSKGFGLETAW